MPQPKQRKPLSKSRKPTGELILFKAIWASRPHVSFVSGKLLHEFNVSLFAHVLPKAQNRYPKFRLYDKNIVLLTPEEHHFFDNMRQDQLANRLRDGEDWDRLFRLRDSLIEEYRQIL